MRLGMFMMPMHALGRNPTQTMREDRATVMLADELGYHDVFVGEHLTDTTENITNSMIFLATLIHSTKRIKLATGTCNLSQMHPTLIAAQAAMFDHLAEGRFIFGISPGALPSDFEALGMIDVDRAKLFSETIDVILAIWQGQPPYDIDLPDNRYKVTTRQSYDPAIGIGIMPKPYQQPWPEIVGTVVAPFSKGVVLMGERNFHPISANFLLAKWAKTHWVNYVEGKRNVGLQADSADWRVARTIFVADDDATARRYAMEDANSPYRFYYEQLYAKVKKRGGQAVFKQHKDQPDSEITMDYVMKHLVMHGSVNSVVDQILALRQEIGDFGELVYAGMDWVDEKLTKRSMQLMAEQVMPRVNAAIAREKA
jgi:alkanesulfonate monooxygenase SsuD/methylene tetrahydromethanopterin reductase-like flavin-dependent oxidoreductase (luciferase family)